MATDRLTTKYDREEGCKKCQGQNDSADPNTETQPIHAIPGRQSAHTSVFAPKVNMGVRQAGVEDEHAELQGPEQHSIREPANKLIL